MIRAFYLLILIGIASSFGGVELWAAEELVLGDFEGTVEALFVPNTGSTRFEVTSEHATRGTSALKVTCRGQYPGLQVSQPQDWSAFTLLRLDVFNPGTENIALSIDIRDEESTRDGQWANRCGRTLQAEPGMNELELNISSLKCNQNPRLINIAALRTVLMYVGKVEGERVFFVDNIRLEKPDVLDVPDAFAFDFGPEGSALFPGFTAVTEKTVYGTGQAWGWERPQGDARNRQSTPEALCVDFVRADGTFKVNVANGRYRFRLIRADSGDWGFLQHWARRIIKAEGQTVSDESMSRQEFYDTMLYRSLDHEDLPGGDVWNGYIIPRWKEEVFEADVADGCLDITFQGDSWGNTLNSLIVYPVAHAAAAETWAAQINAAREANFRKTFVEVVPADGRLEKTREKDGTIVWKPVEDPALKFHEPITAEQQRGYVVFQRPYQDTVYPKSRPRDEELTGNISCALARDEYEPLVFSISPLKDLGRVTVELGPLSGPEGRTFPAGDIRPGWVEYKLHRTGLSATSYRCMPRLIREGAACLVPAGICRRFWFTLYGGADTPAGTYTGTLAIRPEHGETAELAVSVTVRPFSLAERMDRYFVLCSSVKLDQRFTWFRDMEGAWERLEMHWKDYRAHGFNFIHTGLQGEDLDRAIQITKKYGAADTLKIGCHGYQNMDADVVLEKFRAFARPYVTMAAERSWPTVTFVLLDEPANDPGLRSRALKSMEALQPARKEGILFTGDINGRDDSVFFKYMDYTGMNDGLNICDATLKACREAGSVPWLVNTGKERFYWGFWFYKASEEYNVAYKEDYAYMTWHGDPYFDLDQWNPDFCAAFPGPDGPIPSPWYEECREGIDDFRYLSMLGALVKTKGNAEAQTFLQNLLTPVNLDLSENSPWDGKRCAEAREAAAALIVKLEGLPAVVPAPADESSAALPAAAAPLPAPPAAADGVGVPPAAAKPAPQQNSAGLMLFALLGIGVVVIAVIAFAARSKPRKRKRGE